MPFSLTTLLLYNYVQLGGLTTHSFAYHLHQMEKARRRHVPAFGEWNYYYGDELPVTGYAQEASSEIWFKYSPPPRKPTKKVRKDGVVLEKQQYSGEQKQKARVSDARAHLPAKARAVDRAVDADLYQVHPDLLPQKPRRRRVARRSLWMGGCLGLNCVA